MTLRALLLAAAAALHVPAAGAQAPEGPPPPLVEVDTAELARIAPVSWLPATVFSRHDARVANELGGRVVEVAEVGREVRRGDALARIDDAMLRLRERENLADIGRIEAQLGNARLQEQRLEALMAKASVSGSQLDTARAERVVLERSLDQARVALDRTRHEIRRSVVRAPFDGVVSERFVEAGEYLATGQAVIRLVDLGALELRARVPVDLVAALETGMGLSVRGDGRLDEARLQSLVPVGEAAARQFELRLSLDGGDVAVGSALELGVPTAGPRDAVAVPRDAVVMRRDGSYVLRIDEAGVARRVAVELGTSQGERVEVVGAVAPGDRLVVRGAERLQPGRPVRVAGDALPGADAGMARSQP